MDKTKFEFVSEVVVGRDFRGENIDRFWSVDSLFVDCVFDGLRLGWGKESSLSFGAGPSQSVYQNCSFDRARLHIRTAGNTRFESCSFVETTIKDWWAFDVELIDCTFSGRLTRSWFNGSVQPQYVELIGRSLNEFRGNDFSAARLEDVEFRTGIDLSAQVLPTGPDYLLVPDAAVAVEKAADILQQIPDVKLRTEALSHLSVDRSNVEMGQSQLFIGSLGYSKRGLQALRAVMDAHRQSR